MGTDHDYVHDINDYTPEQNRRQFTSSTLALEQEPVGWYNGADRRSCTEQSQGGTWGYHGFGIINGEE
jgi:hypothetical protein